MDLQLFYRDSEQAETWLAKQEAFLANKDLGTSLDDVESLLKKHEDFEKSLEAQEAKVQALDDFAEKLIENQHYAADEIQKRRSELLERREALLDRAAKRRQVLNESAQVQHFFRDADEGGGVVGGGGGGHGGGLLAGLGDGAVAGTEVPSAD